jgi:hypothetical protein
MVSPSEKARVYHLAQHDNGRDRGEQRRREAERHGVTEGNDGEGAEPCSHGDEAEQGTQPDEARSASAKNTEPMAR